MTRKSWLHWDDVADRFSEPLGDDWFHEWELLDEQPGDPWER